MFLVWWFMIVWHVGANVLVDKRCAEGVCFIFPSLESYVTVGSVVWLDVFREGGVYDVDPCSQFCFSVVEVVVACFVPVYVEGDAPVVPSP